MVLKYGCHSHSIWFCLLQWLAYRWEYGQSVIISGLLLENFKNSYISAGFSPGQMLLSSGHHSVVAFWRGTKPRNRGTRPGYHHLVPWATLIFDLSATPKGILIQEQIGVFFQCITVSDKGDLWIWIDYSRIPLRIIYKLKSIP